jgi:predicted nucleotidyltransferase
LKEVVSFRLAPDSIGKARAKAAGRGKTFTQYLEDLVMSDIDRSSPDLAARPAALRVLRTLQLHKRELGEIGIRHAGLFGSVARGEDRPDSDVDILVDLDPAIVRDLLSYGRVQRTLQDLIGRPVDVARRDKLRKDIEDEIARDNIYAF